MYLYFAKLFTKLPLPKLSCGAHRCPKRTWKKKMNPVTGSMVHCPGSPTVCPVVLTILRCPLSSLLGESQLQDHAFLNGEAMLKDLKGNGGKQPGVPND